MSQFEMDEISALKVRVAELEQKIDFLLRALHMQYAEEGSEENKQIEDLLRRGNKIEAIRIYRERTGVGLKEAKDAVEEIERRLG